MAVAFHEFAENGRQLKSNDEVSHTESQVFVTDMSALAKNRCYHKNHAIKRLKKRKIDKWANKSYFSTLIIWTQLKRILLKYLQYISGPPEVKPADLEKNVEKDAKIEQIEPQPTEHKVWYSYPDNSFYAINLESIK